VWVFNCLQAAQNSKPFCKCFIFCKSFRLTVGLAADKRFLKMLLKIIVGSGSCG